MGLTKDCITCIHNKPWTKEDLDKGELEVCFTCKDFSNWKGKK